ncbi:cytoplasmic dynein 2 light intermediate chain 1 [Parasteatoda tepidariorum]|uniref:cytoplasmic dynein 2 light intermediate chain 1 n=1 Tax=Parasteatoda tepidariorum TaxID=114398 RepID=UPI001C724B87|nr:cytoplasmic dynein 2 light intermediate chain 1 [Parasteatoda tepidariorum]XP_015919119.2 cytoplasmic dynein 2 light intermediate chain 1 [Parasteatoda tepidariorum]
MKNLWDIAVEQYKENDLANRNKSDSVLLLIGSKKGGKSTICYKFLERTETPKNTLALEYLFGRRSKGIETGKEICHIWELGGGTLFMDLLEIPITPENLRNLSVVLVLDLSKPEELWYTMQTLLDAVKKRIDEVVALSKDPNLKQSLYEQAKSCIPNDHEDFDSIDPFPVPLLIMGSKYDLFQTEDFQKRKLISKCLRYVAHSKAATLQFVSSKSEALINKARVSISALVFGTTSSKSTIVDLNKPLYICAGADSFQSIGSFTTLNVENKSLPKSLDAVKNIFSSHFPQVESKNIIPNDPAEDPHFKESDIDAMRTQKKKELLEYKNKKHQRSFNEMKY